MAQSRHVARIASVVACFTVAVLRVYQSWPHDDVAASPITIARVCAMLPLASLGVGAIALCPAVVSAWLVRRVFPRRNLAMQALLATEMRLCICAVATIGSLRSAKAMTFHARLLAADLVPVATATAVMLALTGVVVVGGAAAFGHRAMERLNSVVAARFLFSGVRIADVRVRGLQVRRASADCGVLCRAGGAWGEARVPERSACSTTVPGRGSMGHSHEVAQPRQRLHLVMGPTCLPAPLDGGSNSLPCQATGSPTSKRCVHSGCTFDARGVVAAVHSQSPAATGFGHSTSKRYHVAAHAHGAHGELPMQYTVPVATVLCYELHH